jgi:hypothetical protein
LLLEHPVQVVAVEEHSVQGERHDLHTLSLVSPYFPEPHDVVQVFTKRRFGEEQLVQSVLVPPLQFSQIPAHVLHVQSEESPYLLVPQSDVQV